MAKDRKLFATLYFDEDVSIVVARIIRAHGFDVISATEANLRSKTDEQQLCFAAKQRRIFVTHNIKDFIRLHKEYINKSLRHHGIILAVRRRDNYEFAKRLLNLLQQVKLEDLNSQVRFV